MNVFPEFGEPVVQFRAALGAAGLDERIAVADLMGSDGMEHDAQNQPTQRYDLFIASPTKFSRKV
jgi:hypothetical protein